MKFLNTVLHILEWMCIDISFVFYLRTGWSDDQVSIPSRGREFSIRNRVHTGSGAHSVSYPMGTWSFLHRGKAAGSWSWPLTSF